MSISIIRGTNDKHAASSELESAMADCYDVSGHLFIGYPIVSTPEGRHTIDALLVSRDRGLVVFDLVEGPEIDDYRARQDDSANRLEAKLKTHRALTRGRRLAIPIHALSFAPGAQIPEAGTGDGYLISNRANLSHALRNFKWDQPDESVYETALSAIENISSIRRSNRQRSVTRPDSRGAKLRKLEDSIATLDATQGRAVIESVDGVQRIRGLAGSGKTIVLALKAAYLHAQHPAWRIAVTFNTRSLKGHFRHLINNFSIAQTGEEPDWRNLRIVNAWGAPGPDDRDGLYYEFCRMHGFEYFDFGSARQRFWGREFPTVCARALEQLQRSDTPPQPLYDAILVDEAQDLPDSFLRICYELLRDPHRLVYAYDELQNLAGEPVSSPEVMFGARTDGTPRVRFDHSDASHARDLILEKCYRNSRPVLVTAHALGFGIYRETRIQGGSDLVQMFDSPRLWREIGYRVREGELQDGSPVVLRRTDDASPRFLEDHSPLADLVQFIHFQDANEQIEWVASAIKENLAQDEMRHDDIFVINPNPLTTRQEVGPIRRRLLELGINSHLAGVDTTADTFFQDHDSVTFTGIHRAKGNEAGMVYVINAQDCHGQGRNLARIRNQLFVAITRSKAWVRVLGVGAGMRSIEAEYGRLVENDFELRFTYPSQEQREHLRIVHRDMTDSERERVRKSKKEIENLVDDLESGNLHVDDLDDEMTAKLQKLLANRRR